MGLFDADGLSVVLVEGDEEGKAKPVKMKRDNRCNHCLGLLCLMMAICLDRLPINIKGLRMMIVIVALGASWQCFSCFYLIFIITT